mgnify:CR=1 FL=1
MIGFARRWQRLEAQRLDQRTAHGGDVPCHRAKFARKIGIQPKAVFFMGEDQPVHPVAKWRAAKCAQDQCERLLVFDDMPPPRFARLGFLAEQSITDMLTD